MHTAARLSKLKRTQDRRSVGTQPSGHAYHPASHRDKGLQAPVAPLSLPRAPGCLAAFGLHRQAGRQAALPCSPLVVGRPLLSSAASASQNPARPHAASASARMHRKLGAGQRAHVSIGRANLQQAHAPTAPDGQDGDLDSAQAAQAPMVLRSAMGHRSAS